MIKWSLTGTGKNEMNMETEERERARKAMKINEAEREWNRQGEKKGKCIKRQRQELKQLRSH